MQSPPMNAVYLSIYEAAARKGCSRQSLYAAMRDGRLRYTQIGDRRLITPADVDALQLAPRNEDRRAQGWRP